MEESISIKQVIISAGIALGFIAVLVVAILALDVLKSGNSKIAGASTTPAEADDMASMHAPPSPADNTKFQSLLGLPAPLFKLQSYDGREVDLASFRGKNVVLFFSEGAMCAPSCWDQINAFTKDSGFSKENTVVLVVVVDSKADWDGVVREDPKIAAATVLLDSDRKVSESYGVLTVDSSMHRGQFPGHTYVVVDKDGVIRYEKDDPDMRINNKELLANISKLNK